MAPRLAVRSAGDDMNFLNSARTVIGPRVHDCNGGGSASAKGQRPVKADFLKAGRPNRHLKSDWLIGR